MHRDVTDPAIGPTREQVAECINRAMARFPLILEILDELAQPLIPHPADAEIRHGCDRGLTAMLAALSKLHPATGPQEPIGHEEEVALTWLLGEMPRTHIDPCRLERLDQFIHQLLPPTNSQLVNEH